MPVEAIYTICLLVGVIYTITAFVLGGFGGHFGDAGNAGSFTHDYGVGGHDTGQGSAFGSTAEGGEVIFGPFSPIVIAFFLTSFGGTGLILVSSTRLPVVSTLLMAALSGFVLAWLMVKFFNRVLGRIQSSSEVRVHTLIGLDAEVTVAIPQTGVGEIAYIAMGSRYVAPARSDETTAIPRYSAVRITRIVGHIFFVRPVMEEQLRAMPDVPRETAEVGEKSE